MRIPMKSIIFSTICGFAMAVFLNEYSEIAVSKYDSDAVSQCFTDGYAEGMSGKLVKKDFLDDDFLDKFFAARPSNPVGINKNTAIIKMLELSYKEGFFAGCKDEKLFPANPD